MTLNTIRTRKTECVQNPYPFPDMVGMPGIYCFLGGAEPCAFMLIMPTVCLLCPAYYVSAPRIPPTLLASEEVKIILGSEGQKEKERKR